MFIHSIQSQIPSIIGLNTLHVPPITVSNPSDSCGITEKVFDICTSLEVSTSETQLASTKSSPPPIEPEPRKEQRSVMRELLAFVRKPSKKVATRTGKFAAAFTRAESNSASPLMRQSTFSSAPRASSGAAKSAVTKQLSEAGLESKMSLKILNSKMSFRLRRTAEKSKEKKSSGEEISDIESDAKSQKFELENVRFEKVGESYIKHEKIREETIEDSTPSPVRIVDINIIQFDNHNKKTNNVSNDRQNETQMKITGKTETNNSDVSHGGHFKKDENSTSVDSIKEDGITINGNLAHTTSFTDDAINTLKNALEHFVLKPEPVYAKVVNKNLKDTSCIGQKTELQCPTFEIMPPSRRSSFDPPRSPYLENLRSPCETDPETINLNRFDSAGDSFEIIDTDRNHESSFESRYPSSSHTSFDISRYQSTSCEDQTSSFEIIDNDGIAGIEIRKSSIELVDVETFQKSGHTGRKSSLETHFDFELPSSRLSTPRAKKQISEANKQHGLSNLGMKSHYSSHHRTHSPLLNQTSSNYSSRESHDSYSYSSTKWHQQQGQTTTSPQRSPFADPIKQHFPIFGPATNESSRFICTDHRCAAIFEPRPCTSSYLSSHLTSSSEFEPPSPRRAASASPKHTFTFRIVLKKVDSSPEALCPSSERRRSKDRTERIRRRDSRKKRFWETGKSF